MNNIHSSMYIAYSIWIAYILVYTWNTFIYRYKIVTSSEGNGQNSQERNLIPNVKVLIGCTLFASSIANITAVFCPCFLA